MLIQELFVAIYTTTLETYLGGVDTGWVKFVVKYFDINNILFDF